MTKRRNNKVNSTGHFDSLIERLVLKIESNKVHQVMWMVLFLAHLGGLQVDIVQISSVAMPQILYLNKMEPAQNILSRDLVMAWKILVIYLE
jgi:hypothetical protein